MKRTLSPLFFFAFALALLFQGCIIAGGPSLVTLFVDWTFAGGNDACPGDVDDIVIRIDGRDAVTVPCSLGDTAVKGLTEGTYRIRVEGLDGAGGISWQSAPVDVNVVAGGPARVIIDLQDI